MSYPTSQFLNSVGSGGTSSSPFLSIFIARDPNPSDINYPIQKRWVNSLTNAIWVLESLSSIGGVITALWRPLAPIVYMTRDPASSDYLFPLGQPWLNTATKAYWILVSVSGTTATWDELTSSSSAGVLTLSDGTAMGGVIVPPNSSGNIQLADGTNIATVAGVNEITIGITGQIAVANGGTGAATLTGVLVGNGTSPVTGNPISQYDVLVGGAANAITSISPTTATYVLTSNGTVANPSFQAIPFPAAGFISINRKLFTSTGAYTPTAGTTLIYVEVLGGGGGGTGGTGVFVQSGAGGGAGEYAADFFSPTAQTVTIGAAGVGGFDNSLNATAGGTTSFGAIITAVGGAGATVGYVTASPYICNAGALGGTGGTGGSANAIRHQGESGGGTISSTGFPGYPGTGGSSVYGAGAQFVWATGTAVNGVTAINGYGAGGSGGLATSSSSSSGGNGSPGVCIITEYIT